MNHERDDLIETLLRKQFDGPVRDEGFSQCVMHQVPLRRRRATWPLWSSVFVGAAACWLTLLSSPLLHAGWRDWLSGRWSASVIAILLAMLGLTMLALIWGVTESNER